jgi:hypothetical protein
MKDDKLLAHARGLCGCVGIVDNVPGLKWAVVLVDIGLVGTADHVFAALLKFQRAVHLNYKFANAKVPFFIIHEYALFLGVGPLNLEKMLEPIKECASRDLLAKVCVERRLLLEARIRIKLNILDDLVESYLQYAWLIRGDCIGRIRWW